MNEMVQKGPDEKFCSECGAIIKAKAEICPKCGVRQMPDMPSAKTAGNGRSRIVAAFLAFFLGGLGVHKLYLGQIGLGIVYLIFCWTLIPSIIGFVESIILFSMNDEQFSQKYNKPVDILGGKIAEDIDNNLNGLTINDIAPYIIPVVIMLVAIIKYIIYNKR